MATWKGLEPSTSSVTGWHSNQLNYQAANGGTNRARTCDPLLVRQVLSQLSYGPEKILKMERVKGIEPSQPAWKAGTLPLSYTRISFRVNTLKTAYHLKLTFRQRYSLATASVISVAQIHHLSWSSPRPISIDKLNTLLHLHLRPINQVVFLGSYPYGGKSYLEVGFALRCFQRLSIPYIATQPCPWQNNWYTRGTSIPVLSY